ncbi:hypothetical protein N7452_004220 [Penicillium brevicompactum]|uniref:Uncharacterized protein n=1 Tax=Penicillium brevicompactum TaxID=5074 RepID=A0A9W9QV25_PENBR|nr:hypothetical protein N7452_004220 [Penicillium brevicompactum]
MAESKYPDPELRILTERCRTYQGTAKVNISQITPHPSTSQHMNIKNVERLCEIFDKEGCRRLDIYNHVSAVVSRQHLHEALQAGRVDAADLMTDQPNRYPHIHFSAGSIQCLHGQHRLKAGEHYLPLIDQWWTVDLYSDDISPDLQTSLVDEYSNERVPSDGEIYLKVRQYRNEANSHFENRWLARLSDNKARRLRGLESHPSVRAAFDSLLVLPSLMIHGMQIGSLPQVLAIYCDEEIVHALDRLLQYWSALVGHDRAKMLKVDPLTMETLQLLAPGVSSKDRTTVKGLLHSGEVFSNFTESERRSIWKRMKRTEGIIPSLYTFFKDLWYLESCAQCIKRLITPSRSFPTIRTAMRAAFSSFDSTHAQLLIQTSEDGFRTYSHSQGDPAEIGYRQLWLYAMRHYPKLSKKSPKKGLTAKPNSERVEPMILYEMAVLAKRLGFQSPQIEQLIQESPDRQIAQDALSRARRPDRYQYNEEEIESLINKVTECFSKAVPLNHKLSVQFVDGRECKKESRCGYPQAEAQLQDCQFLFFDQIHGDSPQRERKATSILVRRSVYFTFFGKLPIPRENDDTVGRPPTPDLPTSPLFVPGNRSPQDEGEGFRSRGTGAEQHSSLERQCPKDARRERRQQKQAKKLRRRQQRQQRRHRSSHADRNPLPYSRNLSILSSGADTETARIISEDRGSGIEEALQSTVETESGLLGSRGTIVGNEQGIPVMEPAAADQLEHGHLAEEDHDFCQDEELEDSRAELGFEDERPQGGSEESIPGEYPEDASMEEHASEQGNEGIETTAQLSSAEEVEKTLGILEGRGASEIKSGLSRTVGRSAALREKARFRPYDSTQRHRRNPKLSIPPQEVLEHDINALLQTAAQEQTTRPTTQIDFLDAQNRRLLEMDEGRPSWLVASQVDLIQNHQHVLEEKSDSEYFELQPEISSSIDQNFERHGTMNARSEQETQSSESVPPDSLQQVAKHPAVTILFRARDKHGVWNHVVHQMVVDPSDPSPVERMASKNVRERQATFYDQNLRQVAPGQCFNAAIEDGTNTIFMTFGTDLVVSEETVDSVARILQADCDHDRLTKRRQ